MKQMQTILLLLKKDHQILLAMRKQGYGAGKYNGVGGKLAEGETPERAMIRKAQEKIGITPTEYYKVGNIESIEFYKGEKLNLVFHLYIATKWTGEPTESDEMQLYWFNLDQIPYEQMFLRDSYWMPYLLEGKRFNAFLEFDEDWHILSHKIEALSKEVEK